MAPEDRTAFVVVAGSIAAGKTGLVTRLAKALDAVPLREEVGGNPYFERFYEDPERWAFHSQVAFAADSLARHARVGAGQRAVQDRSIHEVVDVFCRLLLEAGDLDADEFSLLAALRDAALELPRQPTAMVYLHAPPAALLKRATARGRPAERRLTHDYLKRLQRHYDEFLNRWSSCPVIAVDATVRDLRQETEIDALVSELRTAQEV